MRVHGLFIGIDRYLSPLVSELACAARDAEALYCLFADTFGTDSMLLLQDESATRARIIDDFESRLSKASEEDFVFISYAGHGSDDFFLVTYDADPSNLSATSIALDELVALFARIPSKRVILVLDCCFSGGAGARVFHHGLPTRSLDSVSAALGRLADEGRIILTACDPSQEAIEDPMEGHGMLTRHLIDALRGAPEIVNGGQIGIYDLLGHVTQRVFDDAASVGHEQRPTFRGTVDGELKLPVFVAGAEYARRFPGRVAPPVSGDLDDLVAHGLPKLLVDAVRAGIPALNALQIEAVNSYGLLAGRSLVVSAPTSSGKTMIGELAALLGASKRRRALFLMPLKALVADKYSDLTRKYGALGVRIRRATGDMNDDVPDLLNGRFDICLLTYEKATALLLAFPHVLRGVGSIVVDEVQMLADESRGANLEFLLTLVRDRRRHGVRPQLVLLSAVIGATNGLERWIGGGLLRSDARPIPLDEGVVRGDGSFRSADADGAEKVEQVTHAEFRRGTAQDVLIPLVRTLVEAGESVIVFRETKSETRSVATYLARELRLPAAEAAISSLPTSDLSAASSALVETLRGGVAFHNADLAADERVVVETAFRSGSGVRVIVATTTLAMGINTPASTVLIAGLEHPGSVDYSVAEYKNMVGRAGRQGFSNRGKSMIVCMTPMEEHRMWTHYVKGQPEALLSRFLDADPASLICRILVTAGRASVGAMTEAQVLGFVESSFGSFQVDQRLRPRRLTRETLLQTLERLVAGSLVSRDGDSYRVTDLGRIAGENGVSVESVLRVAEALRATPAVEIGDAALIAAAQLTTELEGVLMPLHKTSIQERDRWQGALRGQGLPERLLRAVLSGEGSTARAKRTAAALMWIQGKDLNAIEASMVKHVPRNDAAGAIRSVADRTRDLLPVAVRVAELVLDGTQEAMATRGDRLLVQLELGVPAAMVPIGKLLGSRLARGEYLALHAAGLSGTADVSAQTDAQLERILGSAEKVRMLRDAHRRLAAQLAAVNTLADTMPDGVDGPS